MSILGSHSNQEHLSSSTIQHYKHFLLVMQLLYILCSKLNDIVTQEPLLNILSYDHPYLHSAEQILPYRQTVLSLAIVAWATFSQSSNWNNCGMYACKIRRDKSKLSYSWANKVYVPFTFFGRNANCTLECQVVISWN